MRLSDIEMQAAAALGVPLVISHADTPAKSPGAAERRQLARFRFEERRRDWLVGRNALQQLMRRQGRPDDAAALRLPAAGISLTHGAGHAFAVGAPSRGIGIDFERPRRVHPRMASWFLDDGEQSMLPQRNGAAFDRELVRLWTIKEAAFKSHPDNAELTLADLRIESRDPIRSFEVPDPLLSCSVSSVRGLHMRVFTATHRGGFLSIAGVTA